MIGDGGDAQGDVVLVEFLLGDSLELIARRHHQTTGVAESRLRDALRRYGYAAAQLDIGPILGDVRSANIGFSRGPIRKTAPYPLISDLRRLAAFVTVAEELHFRRAATRLCMTQSPLSRMIRKLEQEVGAPLFERSRRRVQLSPVGRALLSDARDILSYIDAAVTRACCSRAQSHRLPDVSRR